MPRAHKITDSCTLRFKDGMRILDYTEIWQVVHDDPFRNSIDVFNATSGLPLLGQQYIVGGFNTYCIDAVPSKVSDDHKSLWQFSMRFTNDPAALGGQDETGQPAPFDPTRWAKTVDISFEKEYTQVTSATLERIEDKNGNARPVPDYLVGYSGPVVDTATAVKAVETPTSKEKIVVSRIISTWNDFAEYHDTINSKTVTISDGFGVNKTFPANTLRFDRVTKQDIWTTNAAGKYTKIYRQAVELSYDPNKWEHHEPDAGTEQLAKVGQTFNPATNLHYTQDEVNELAGVEKDEDGNWKTDISQVMVGITTEHGSGIKVGVGGTVGLNSMGTVAEGNGKILNLMPFKLVYKLYAEKDFGSLGL
tara:strand:+ start:2481 stop:3569 length:1089 start_codon:yes stop_codon:yes gene_type:complete